MQTLTIEAPAKLNLYLKILDKRPDGFHNIETIFEKIDLCDKITLRKRRCGIKVSCRHRDVPRDQSNLAARAARAVLSEVNRDQGVAIKIDKKIPVAAGLGGGSSDAASVLLGVNQLFSLGLKQSRLLELAEGLGADVPFFLLGRFRAIGRGKGEILTPLPTKRKNWYVLVIPKGLSLSTRQMYHSFRITLTKQPFSVKIALRALEKGDLTSFNRYSYNSFESILQKKYNIEKIKKALESSGARATLISGSGPCVFGVCATRKEAIETKGKLRARDRNWQVIVAKTYANNKKED